MITWLTLQVTSWKFIARWLGISETDVSRIETDNPKDDREQCYQMFLKWKAIDPKNYTYTVLGDALRRESQELYQEFVNEVQKSDLSPP